MPDLPPNDRYQQQRNPLPPTWWGADMTVRHRITESTGSVVSVDFEEDLVTVLCGEYELHWRIENTYEVTP